MTLKTTDRSRGFYNAEGKCHGPVPPRRRLCSSAQVAGLFCASMNCVCRNNMFFFRLHLSEFLAGLDFYHVMLLPCPAVRVETWFIRMKSCETVGIRLIESVIKYTRDYPQIRAGAKAFLKVKCNPMDSLHFPYTFYLPPAFLRRPLPPLPLAPPALPLPPVLHSTLVPSLPRPPAFVRRRPLPPLPPAPPALPRPPALPPFHLLGGRQGGRI